MDRSRSFSGIVSVFFRAVCIVNDRILKLALTKNGIILVQGEFGSGMAESRCSNDVSSQLGLVSSVSNSFSGKLSLCGS